MVKRVHILLSMFYSGVGYSSAAVALALESQRLTDATLYLPQAGGTLPEGLNAARPFPFTLADKWAQHPRLFAWARRRTEAKLLRAVRREGPGALVWLWPGASIGLMRALKQAGAILVREMINTHRGTAKRILDVEYQALGLPPRRVTGTVPQEQEELSFADYFVSPGEGVDASLREWGVGDDRIIKTTFGWYPADFAHGRAADLPGKGPHALFVGQVGVRKGIHLALAAWDRAQNGGTFVIVGRVAPEAEHLVAPYRGRDDIVFLPFTRDLESLYRAADFMFFPSLEEGAPLVCYQAAGCGLAILTSPMGAGRVVEDGVSGLIVDPHDGEGMTRAIRRMSDDPAARARFALAAKARADHLTWRAAAAERLRIISDKLGQS